MKLILIQDAYIQSGEYRLHTDEGKPSIYVLKNWYEAYATDADDNKYLIIWKIKPDFDIATNPDEYEACNWNTPEEIIQLDTGKNVTDQAEIIG